MRVLFLESNPIWIYGLPNGFRDDGHKVMISGPLTENNIFHMITEFKPELIVSIGWGLENSKKKQEWIKDQVHKFAIPLIYWAVEDPAFTTSWSLPLIQNIQPDFVFTIAPSKVNYYKAHGVKAAYMDFGYHPDIHCPVKVHPQYQCSIAVVANAYPDILKKYPQHYRHFSLNTLIRPLLIENIRIDFWGKNWDQMKSLLGLDIPEEWIHGFLPYKDANCVYSSADITLGLQNYSSQVTQRTYEILGSGGFLLTNNTSGLRQLFKPGHDLIASSSAEETVQLVHHYLEHPEQRKLIREQGRTAVLAHNYRNRARNMIEILHKNGIVHAGKAVETSGEIYYYANYSDEKYELYVVKPADSLWAISRKFGVTVEELKKINGLVSDEIYIDQILRIREIPQKTGD